MHIKEPLRALTPAIAALVSVCVSGCYQPISIKRLIKDRTIITIYDDPPPTPSAGVGSGGGGGGNECKPKDNGECLSNADKMLLGFGMEPGDLKVHYYAINADVVVTDPTIEISLPLIDQDEAMTRQFEAVFDETTMQLSFADPEAVNEWAEPLLAVTYGATVTGDGVEMVRREGRSGTGVGIDFGFLSIPGELAWQDSGLRGMPAYCDPYNSKEKCSGVGEIGPVNPIH